MEAEDVAVIVENLSPGGRGVCPGGDPGTEALD